MAGSLWEKEGESGLLDNFEFTITSGYFATNEKYVDNNGGHPWLINWEGTTDSLDVPIMHVWFSLGAGWISDDDGLTIKHESDNPEKFFNKTSQYYKVLARCRDDFKIVQILEAHGSPLVGASWEGLRFRMKNEKQAGIRGSEGKDKQFPVEFLGEVDDNSSNGSSTTKSSAKAATTTTTSETPQQKMARMKAEKEAAKNEASTGDVDVDAPDAPSLKDQVIGIINESEDFEMAQAAAMELEGFMDDDDLMQSMMDADGLYAEIKAGVSA